MKHRLSFNAVLPLLEELRSAAIDALRQTRGGDEAALARKREFDLAIDCLKFCERYQMHPDAEVTTLPWPRDAFGDFLVVDVNELGEASSWMPVTTAGEPITLYAGDLVVRQAHPFNLPTGRSKAPEPDADGPGP